MNLSSKNLFNPVTEIFIIIVLVPAFFYTTTLAMIDVWMVNETFTHGFLIFPISIWLIWQNRNSIIDVQPAPEPKVFVLLVMSLALWFVSKIVEVQIVQQLAMIAMIPIIIWILLGRKVLMMILFPILYLFFSIPLGQSLIPPLMEFTANFTVYLVNLTGIPIYQDGLYFTLPSGNWSVIEECSGVRYLIASIALGSLFAYISYQSQYKRLIFIIIAIVVPIIANGLRAFGIVMIGHFSGMTLATGADHLLYGWVFFGIVIFLLFYIGSFWSETKSTNTTEQIVEWKSGNQNYTKLMISICFIVILFALTKVYVYQVTQPSKVVQKEITLTLPDYFEGWQVNSDFSTGWSPIIKKADQTVEKSYRFGSDFVQLNIAFYSSQRQGMEAVSSYNRLTSPLKGKWNLVTSTDLQEASIYVNESEIRSGDNKLLIWKWYRIGKMVTPNPYIAKILDAYNQIFTGRKDASMITLATTMDLKKLDARHRLISFSEEAMPQIYLELEKIVK
jgi:exosortase A